MEKLEPGVVNPCTTTATLHTAVYYVGCTESHEQ